MGLVLLLLFVIICCVTAFIPEPLPHHIPHGWRRGGVANPTGLLDVHIGLRRDTSMWEHLLLERADPLSTRYGQWFDRARVVEMSRPSQSCVDDVKRWVRSDDYDDDDALTIVGHGDWLHARLSVGQVSKMLGTTFYTFLHTDQSPLVRCEQYTVPDSLRDCVELVEGVKRLPPRPIFRRSRRQAAHSRDEVVGWSPNDLRTVWNVGSVQGNSSNGQIQSVAEFNAGENFSPSDLTQFQRGWKIAEQKVARVLGPNDPR